VTLDCPTIATKLTLFNAGGMKVYVDTTSGIKNCSAIIAYLKPGAYYIQVEKASAGVISKYQLQAKFLASAGSETEPNATQATANGLPGTDTYILGDIPANDVDYFSITVAAGQSIRAETIEGIDGITCDSNYVDSTLTFYNSAGTQLVSDTNTGRGNCSLIDGTGAVPLNAGAHNLAAGTYFLRVKGSISTTLLTYRLAVTVRSP